MGIEMAERNNSQTTHHNEHKDLYGYGIRSR